MRLGSLGLEGCPQNVGLPADALVLNTQCRNVLVQQIKSHAVEFKERDRDRSPAESLQPDRSGSGENIRDPSVFDVPIIGELLEQRLLHTVRDGPRDQTGVGQQLATFETPRNDSHRKPPVNSAGVPPG